MAPNRGIEELMEGQFSFRGVSSFLLRSDSVHAGQKAGHARPADQQSVTHACNTLYLTATGVPARVALTFMQASKGQHQAPAHTAWDRMLLNVMDNCRLYSNCASTLLGCCHRDCTNLEGASESVLQLRKCSGCELAR